MKRIISFLLIILGVVMLAYGGFSYTKKEKVIDAGPIQVSDDREKTIAWPPYVGVILLVGGIVIVATSKKGE